MENENGPVSIFEPDECSQFLVDKFYLAILRGKLKTTRKFLDGGGEHFLYESILFAYINCIKHSGLLVI